MAITITITEPGLLKLLQLSSVSLPVGAYAFSQGMEYAVEAGWVKNYADTEDWLSSQMSDALANVDLPIMMRCMTALESNNSQDFDYWNHYLLACRETKELSLSDTAMGEALLRLLKQYSLEGLDDYSKRPTFLALFSFAAWHWRISMDACLFAYTWAWLENQVAAATKLVPLGQTQAQTLLSSFQENIQAAVRVAKTVSDEEIGSCLPAVAVASALHETQYTRLFRS